MKLVYMSKLGLGTAQFGLDYGIANRSGQIKFSDAKNILQLAKQEKIDLIDTAILYGKSEKIIGNLKLKNLFGLKINYLTNLFKFGLK